MTSKWERTFFVAVPVERAWAAFTDPEERRALSNAGMGPDGVVDRQRAERPYDGVRVVETERHRRLNWVQERGDLPESCEFTVVFESQDNGTRIMVTRAGFGEGEDASVFSEANALGWERGFMDVIAYLQTGRVVGRHREYARSSTGLVYIETDAGLEVLRAAPGSFGESAGLARGDLLLRMAGVGLYQRSDLWALQDLLAAGTEVEVQFARGREILTRCAQLSAPLERAVGEG